MMTTPIWHLLTFWAERWVWRREREKEEWGWTDESGKEGGICARHSCFPFFSPSHCVQLPENAFVVVCTYFQAYSTQLFVLTKPLAFFSIFLFGRWGILLCTCVCVCVCQPMGGGESKRKKNCLVTADKWLWKRPRPQWGRKIWKMTLLHYSRILTKVLHLLYRNYSRSYRQSHIFRG